MRVIVARCPHCDKPHRVKVPTTFETAAEMGIVSSVVQRTVGFWASDGITYSMMGVFGGLLTWWAVGPTAGVVAAFCVGLGLHTLKIFAHAPKPSSSAPTPITVRVHHVETTVDNYKKHMLHEFTPPTTYDDLKKVATVVLFRRSWLSREDMHKRVGLSQTKYNRLTADLRRMEYMQTLSGGRRFELLPAGFEFFESLSKMDLGGPPPRDARTWRNSPYFRRSVGALG